MTSLPALLLPNFADVEAAQKRIAGRVPVTPALESEALNCRLGRRVLIKPECLQITGSFKIRGAYNRLAQLDVQERARGVVAFSSGNHAQGVARAARWLGVKASLIVPADAPKGKIAGAAADGADIILYDRLTEDREALAAQISARTGAIIVPSFDDPHIIAGQGTAGAELAAQATEKGLTLEAVYCCVGGGGLIAGLNLALAALSPQTRVYGAEPAGHDDHARSLAAGERLGNPPGTRSICDALLSERPGALTFVINRQHLAGVCVVSDEEVERAMAAAFADLKLVVEPGGAAALAAALQVARLMEPDMRAGRAIGVLLTGGNVDANQFAAALMRQASVI